MSDYVVDTSVFKNKEFKDFDDSFNFALSTSSQVDMLNNPYFEVNMIDLKTINNEYVSKLSDKLKLRKCTQKELLKFISET